MWSPAVFQIFWGRGGGIDLVLGLPNPNWGEKSSCPSNSNSNCTFTSCSLKSSKTSPFVRLEKLVEINLEDQVPNLTCTHPWKLITVMESAFVL